MVLWISDAAVDHYEEVDTGHEFLSVYVGIDPTLSFAPADDDAFRAFLLDRIAFFVSRSQIDSQDGARLRAACDRA